MSALQLPEITISHRNFSVTIPAITMEGGEILGIFGKSGAGKTSYLKRVRELMNPQDVHYMSQFDGLLEEITVRQNIELGLAASGEKGAALHDWEQRYASLLADFEVDRHLPKYPRAMSGGQRKRAEIVRSLIMNPAVLLLDEPFLGIGHLFEAICTREILARGESGEGYTLIVSHDFDLLCTFSRRIMLVDDKGVIGFMPTRDPSWRPENVRTAWTLAMENVLPADTVRTLDATGLPPVADGESLGFWGWSAVWGADAAQKIHVPKDHIVSVRSALKHGTMYSRVELKAPSHHEPIVLVGKGAVDTGRDVMLGVQNAWALSA